MNSFNVEQLSEKECTPRCHSRQHAEWILNSVTKGSAAEIRAFCNWLCHNFTTVTDSVGRNLLHLCASCGKWEIIEWLLTHCHCDIDVRDAESGWSALHRSFFYGQLSAARMLLNQGANIRMTDHEGLTPLDLIVEDRLPYIEYNKTYPQDVYVWGSNINYNLGLGNEQSRPNAESVEFFHKDNINIKQVIMCKFHTAFLSSHGRLFTCGHGQGGRLGQGSEVTRLTPSRVRSLGSNECLQIAAGQDHLVLLMAGSQVWTSGLNTHHQLGHSPPPEQLLTPRPISLKFLKGKEVVGVCAARFHSVFYTRDSIFTFGLNAGQLGHPKDERTQIIPRRVSGVYHEGWLITDVAASDGATVCVTNQGDVHVLHEFQHRKIASKQIGIQKISVIGGHLDSSCDTAGIREGRALELRVMLLTRSGKLYLWRQTNPYLRRCLFTSNQLIISDIHLNHFSVAMVTDKNQCYMGSIQHSKGKKPATTNPSSPPSTTKSHNMNFFVDREECYIIKAKRLAYVHRATSITSDSKGRNFAVLQASPKMGLLELPVVSESKLTNDMLQFLEETSLGDPFHDVIINVGGSQYAAHKYILASRSEYFQKQFLNSGTPPFEPMKLTIDNMKPEAFEQVLKFVYCNTCDFVTEGYEVKWGEQTVKNNNAASKNMEKKKQDKNAPKKKAKAKDSNDPVKCVQEASRRFNIRALTEMLDHTELVDGKIHRKYPAQIPGLEFDRHKLVDHCDVTLRTEDGIEFFCHKCILAARSDYFHCMFGAYWFEKSNLESFPLPISSCILDILIHYLYVDVDSRINALDDPQLVCNILAVSDQLLITRLKEMCEMALVNLLTLKNACELLELSFLYNAKQLKSSCMEYICINLPAIMEANNLDCLSDDVIDELGKIYRAMVPSMRRRIIVPNASHPSRELLKNVEKAFPIEDDFDVIKQKIETCKVESKSKSRRRNLSQRLDAREPSEDFTPSSDAKSSERVTPLNINLGLEKIVPQKVEDTLKKKNTQPENLITARKPGQWTMPSPILNNSPFLDLDTIMVQQQTTVLQKSPSSHSEFKRVHISQKQRKLMATAHKEVGPLSPKFMENDCARSPPSCPWGKTAEQSSTQQSFWDAVEKGLLQSSSNTSLSNDNSDSTHVGHRNSPTSPIHTKQPTPVVLGLEAIQRAEAAEQQFNSLTAKIKPLHLIHIEDQAIEELIQLYKAKDNPKEKITVARVEPERIATPVWKKRA